MGWQRLKHGPSVQENVEKALSKIADHPVTVFCSGRTDSGVHAFGQIVHFETTATRPDHAWLLGGNANLDDRISIQWVHAVDASFHARFCAEYRRYRYIILNTSSRPAIQRNQVSWIKKPLNAHHMDKAVQALVGAHDFSSFRASGCQAKGPDRIIHEANWRRRGNYVYLDIVANGFLHHMVRNIVGSSLLVGNNEQSTSWLADLLALKDRTQAAATASAKGLYFINAGYPAKFGLPDAKNADQILWPDPG